MLYFDIPCTDSVAELRALPLPSWHWWVLPDPSLPLLGGRRLYLRHFVVVEALPVPQVADALVGCAAV